jgi:hypothetical protein
MIRLIALILSLSIGLFTSVMAGSQGSESVSVIDSVLSDSTIKPQKPLLYARSAEPTRAKINSGKLSLGTRHKRRSKENWQPDSGGSVIAYSRYSLSSANSKSASLSSIKSIFNIKVPGDPRTQFEDQKDNPYKSSPSGSLPGFKKNEKMPVPGDFLNRLGSIPKASGDSYEEPPNQRLEIQVSHSTHIFKLIAHTKSPEPDVLYECKIGLGAPEFPTPVGVYYVTHIYDENPWWIPPANRAWAAGDSPSKRVYGGTMAPLLKKKIATSRKRDVTSEDRIEGQVKLEDYGYRFHGTNAPRSIGRNQSHGCVRMLSDDAKKVAAIIEDKVGIAERKESENGSFAILNAPVRLNLIK